MVRAAERMRVLVGTTLIATIAGLGVPGVALADDPVAIDTVTPNVAASGTALTITGHGFSAVPAENTVRLNGTALAVSAATGTSLSVTVATGATSGAVSVQSPAGSATSAFDVYIPPAPFTVADVESTQRLTAGVSATAVVSTATKVALLTVAGVSGHRFAVRLASGTFGSSSSNARVAVYRPDGTALISPTGFGNSGVFLEPAPLTADGAYQVLIDPQGTVTGQVQVTVYDIAGDVTAAAAPGGGAVTVSVATPGQNAIVSFPGTAGQRVYFGFSGGTFGSSSNAKASVRRPDGTTLLAPVNCGSSCSFDTTTLAVTGTYTVLVDPQSFSIGSLAVQLYEVPADATASVTAGGAPVTMTTTAPGQNAAATFTGVTGQRVFFDFTAGTFGSSSNATVAVRKPDGTALVSAANCGSSCVFDTRTLPADGTYTIYLDPTGTLVGSLTVQLSAVPADATAAVVPGDTAVTLATTVPGQNGVFTFSGTASQRVSFSFTAGTFGSSSNATVTVRKPDGTALVNATSCGSSCWIDTRTLPVTGAYTILMDPAGARVGSLTAQLYDVAADPVIATAIGAPAVAAQTTVPGQNARVTFSATAGQRISVQIAGSTYGSSSSSLSVSVLKPDGTTLISGTGVGSSGVLLGPITVTATGEHTVVLDPATALVGQATVRAYDVADVTVPATIGGGPVTATTTTPGQNATVTFPAVAGQRVAVRVFGSTYGSSSSSLSASLLKPDGTVLVSANGVGSGGLFIDARLLPADGTYTVLLDPAGSLTGSVQVEAISVPADSTAALSLDGTTVSVATTVPGQNAVVTFAGTAGQRVSLRFSNGSGSVYGTVSNPDGSVVKARWSIGSSDFVDPLTLPATGTYTILLDPNTSALGAMDVQGWAVPADSTAALSLDGTTVSVATTVPGQNAVVTFAGTAGQRVSLRFSNGSGSVYGTVSNPDGSVLKARWSIGSGDFAEPLTLASTGTYTVLLDPNSYALGTMTVQAWIVPADAAYTASVGGPAVRVANTVPGQNATVTFSGTAGHRLAVNFSAGAVSVYATIKNPDGTDLKARTSMGTNSFIEPLTLVATGAYTIIVDPATSGVGGVDVQLFDVPADVSATAAFGGPAVTVTTTAPGQNAVVSFAGTAGTKAYIVLDALAVQDDLTALTLRNPAGTTMASNAYVESAGDQATIGPVDLTASGTYTITVNPFTVGTSSIRLRIYDAAPPAPVPATAGGPPVQVSTTVPGQVATAAFTATAGQVVSVGFAGAEFLNGTEEWYAELTLRGPTGTVLAEDFVWTGDTELLPATAMPATGTYTVTIDPADASIGSVTVHVYLVPPPVTVAGEIGGGRFPVELTVPGAEAVISFAAEAAEPFEVNVSSGPGPLDVVIRAPGGAVLCHDTGYLNWGVGCTADAGAGTYTATVSSEDIVAGTWELELTNGLGQPVIGIDGMDDPGAWRADGNVLAYWDVEGTVYPDGYAVVVDASPGTDPGTTATQPDAEWQGTLPDGVHYLHVRAVTNGGFAGPAGHQVIRIDGTAPVLTGVTVTSHPDPQVPVASLTLTATLSTDPDLSGVQYAYAVTHGPDDNVWGAPASGASLTTTLPGEGHWYLHVVAVDAAGNRSGVVHREVLADMAPSAPGITSVTHPVPGTAYPYRDFVAEWQGDVDALAWATVLDQSPATVPAATAASGETRFSAQLAAGTWWLHVRGVDAAGTPGATAHFQVVVAPASVGFTAPTAGRGVWGSVPITLSCSGSLTVQARLGTGAWQAIGVAPENAGSCGLTWDTTADADGSYELQAVDGSTVVTDPLPVTVVNATTVLQRLAFDYQAGTIGVVDYVRMSLFGLTDPAAIPARYTAGASPIGDVDGARASIIKLFDSLPAATRDEIMQWLTPTPIDPPGGRSARASLNSNPDCGFWTRISSRAFSCRVWTDHFTIYYIESEIDTTTSAGNVRPDYIENLKNSLELSRTKFHDNLGYKVPDHVDVLVVPLPLGSGLSLPALGPCTCGDGTMFVDNDYSDIKHLGRHELFHFVQYEYMHGSYAGDYWMNWWMEATANWASHQAGLLAGEPGQDSRYYQSLDDFLRQSQERFDEGNSVLRGGGPEYGAFIVAEYMEDRIGINAVRQTWERLTGWFPPRPGEVIKEVMQTQRVNGNFAEEIQRFREWAYVVDANTGGVGFHDPDAPKWQSDLDFPDNRPPHDTVTIGPATTGSVTKTVDVQQTGARYAEIVNPTGFDADVAVTFDAEDADTRASLVKLNANGEPAYECGDSEPVNAGLSVTLTNACPRAYVTLVNTEEAGSWGTWSDVTYTIAYAVKGLVLTNGFVDIGVTEFGTMPSHGGVGVRLHGQPASEWVDEFMGDGWGVNSSTATGGSAASTDGALGLTLDGFEKVAGANALMSTVTATGNLQVTHRVEPALSTYSCPPQAPPSCVPASKYLFKITVAVTNFGAPTQKVHYRRVVDWDVDESHMSYNSMRNRGGDIGYLVAANLDGGCASPLPSSSYLGVVFEENDVDVCGAIFELNLGSLGSGEMKWFTLYYGVAPSEADAVAAVNAVGAQVYSIGKPETPEGLALGTPSTGILAVDGSSL